MSHLNLQCFLSCVKVNRKLFAICFINTSVFDTVMLIQVIVLFLLENGMMGNFSI